MFSFNNKKGLSAIVFGVLVLLTSCGDFLDIKPYGKAIPKTTVEYQALVNEMLRAIVGTNSAV